MGMRRTKPEYAIDRKNHADDTPMPLALRELQAIVSGPIYWTIVGLAVLLTVMSGPYSTLERLSFPERLVFWGMIVVISSMVMTFLTIYSNRLAEARRWNWALVSTLASAAGVLPVVGSVYLADGLVTGFERVGFELIPFPQLVIHVAPPIVAVTLMVNLVIRIQRSGQPATGAETPGGGKEESAPLTFLRGKLPYRLGQDIVTVRAQDHYVEVTTPRGSAMILMSLGDAVQHLKPLAGLQVHRSWWINLSHVARIEQGPSGPELIMTTDQRIPVGRSFRAAFRDAVQGRT